MQLQTKQTVLLKAAQYTGVIGILRMQRAEPDERIILLHQPGNKAVDACCLLCGDSRRGNELTDDFVIRSAERNDAAALFLQILCRSGGVHRELIKLRNGTFGFFCDSIREHMAMRVNDGVNLAHFLYGIFFLRSFRRVSASFSVSSFFAKWNRI